MPFMTTFIDHFGVISVENAPLGRLVLSRSHPHRDYHDPVLASTIVPTEIEIQSLEAFQQGKTSTTFVAKMTEFLSSTLDYSGKHNRTISAAEVVSRTLNNSTDWFQQACDSGKDTRRWIQEALNRGRKIYLIVGHYVATDTAAAYTRAGRIAASAEARVPATLPSIGTLDAKALASHESECEAKGSVRFPKAVVCAVEYRKLRCRWFSSRTLENTELEHGSRWVAAAAFRGGGPVEEKNILVVDFEASDGEEEESEEEDDDEEDSD